MMTSSRYALPVAVLLTLALIPTFIHSYLGLTAGDDKSVASIQPVLDSFTSEPTNRKHPAWAEQAFGSYDWFERSYRNAQGKPLRLFVGQSFDHKRLYHHPDLALSYGKDMRGDGLTWLAGQPKIPVHLLKNESRPMIVAYVLFYDGKFIANPITHQIYDSLNLLVSASKPMTLFYVADDNAPAGIPFSETPAAALLTKAIAGFVAQQPLSTTN